MNRVNQLIEKIKNAKVERRRLVAMWTALSIVVTGSVSWSMHGVGSTITKEAMCEKDEHQHSDECRENVLTCNIEDDSHVHDESCYESMLVCGMDEHIHNAMCSYNIGTDKESEINWLASLPEELSMNWRKNIVSIARSQLGYTESSDNFIYSDDNTEKKGYTRYGDWYGNPYGDWNTLFTYFCMNYAGVTEKNIPYGSGCWAWTETLAENELLKAVGEYDPTEGDIVFFDTDGDEKADRVGVIVEIRGPASVEEIIEEEATECLTEEASETQEAEIPIEADQEEETIPEETASQTFLYVIEGDVEGEVAETSYLTSDETIFGYLSLENTEMPEQSFDGETGSGIKVHVDAMEGAFPKETVMQVADIADDAALSAASEADDSTNVVGAVAVDISFFDTEGNEIEPTEGSDVRVSIELPNEKTLSGDEFRLYHQKGSGEVETVSKADVSSNGAVFAAESFSTYVISGLDVNLKKAADSLVYFNGQQNNSTQDNPYIVSPGSTIEVSVKLIRLRGDQLGDAYKEQKKAYFTHKNNGPAQDSNNSWQFFEGYYYSPANIWLTYNGQLIPEASSQRVFTSDTDPVIYKKTYTVPDSGDFTVKYNNCGVDGVGDEIVYFRVAQQKAFAYSLDKGKTWIQNDTKRDSPVNVCIGNEIWIRRNGSVERFTLSENGNPGSTAKIEVLQPESDASDTSTGELIRKFVAAREGYCNTADINGERVHMNVVMYDYMVISNNETRYYKFGGERVEIESGKEFTIKAIIPSGEYSSNTGADKNKFLFINPIGELNPSWGYRTVGGVNTFTSAYFNGVGDGWKFKGKENEYMNVEYDNSLSQYLITHNFKSERVSENTNYDFGCSLGAIPIRLVPSATVNNFYHKQGSDWLPNDHQTEGTAYEIHVGESVTLRGETSGTNVALWTDHMRNQNGNSNADKVTPSGQNITSDNGLNIIEKTYTGLNEGLCRIWLSNTDNSQIEAFYVRVLPAIRQSYIRMIEPVEEQVNAHMTQDTAYSVQPGESVLLRAVVPSDKYTLYNSADAYYAAKNANTDAELIFVQIGNTYLSTYSRFWGIDPDINENSGDRTPKFTPKGNTIYEIDGNNNLVVSQRYEANDIKFENVGSYVVTFAHTKDDNNHDFEQFWLNNSPPMISVWTSIGWKDKDRINEAMNGVGGDTDDGKYFRNRDVKEYEGGNYGAGQYYMLHPGDWVYLSGPVGGTFSTPQYLPHQTPSGGGYTDVVGDSTILTQVSGGYEGRENVWRIKVPNDMGTDAKGHYKVDFVYNGVVQSFYFIIGNGTIWGIREHDHADLEINDGGTYRAEQTFNIKPDGTIIETVMTYESFINDIQECNVYLENSTDPVGHYVRGDYSKQGEVGDTQFEYTSKYLTDGQQNRIYKHVVRDSQGNIISTTYDLNRDGGEILQHETGTYKNPYTNLFTDKKKWTLNYTDNAYFMVDVLLRPISEVKTIKHPDGTVEQIITKDFDASDEMIVHNVKLNMDRQSVIDAQNKCPNHSGLDFTIKDETINSMLRSGTIMLEAYKDFKDSKGNNINDELIGGEFQFDLYELANESDPDGKLIDSSSNVLGGNVYFGAQFYVDLDLSGEESTRYYYYKIVERIPQQVDGQITYSTREQKVKVTVVQGMGTDDGKQVPTITVTKDYLDMGTDQHTYTMTAGDNRVVPSFKNIKHLYELPSTGGAGKDILMIGGAGLLALSVVMYKKRRRKEDE